MVQKVQIHYTRAMFLNGEAILVPHPMLEQHPDTASSYNLSYEAGPGTTCKPKKWG